MSICSWTCAPCESASPQEVRNVDVISKQGLVRHSDPVEATAADLAVSELEVGFQPGTRPAPPFAVDGIVASADVLARWQSEGQLHIDQPNGDGHTVDTGMVGISQVVARGKWIAVRGSLFSDDVESAGVGVYDTHGTRLGLWQFPGLIRSIALTHDYIYATTHEAEVLRWSYAADAVPTEFAAFPRGRVHLTAHSKRLTMCSMASNRKADSPEGICRVGTTTIASSIWNSDPILCGSTLVAETRAAAELDSPVRLVSWDVESGRELASRSVPEGGGPYTCASEELLLQTRGRGQTFSVASLEAIGPAACSIRETVFAAVVDGIAVCLQPNGSIAIEPFGGVGG